MGHRCNGAVSHSMQQGDALVATKKSGMKTRGPKKKSCGYAEWKWSNKNWVLLEDKCKKDCLAAAPRRPGDYENEVVRKGCVPKTSIKKRSRPMCGIHECERQAVSDGNGGYMWAPTPVVPCPSGCSCPYPSWNPGANEPNALVDCDPAMPTKKKK